jgi:hypothetical protein
VATDVFEREIRLEAKERNWDIDRCSLVRQQCVRGSASEVTVIFYWNFILVFTVVPCILMPSESLLYTN